MLASSYKIIALIGLLSLALCTLRAANALAFFGTANSDRDGSNVGTSGSLKLGPQEGTSNDNINSNEKQPLVSASGSLQTNFDPATMQQFIEYGMNPVGGSVKYLLPNTMQGFSNDMTNGLSMLNNGAQKGYSTFSSMMPSVSGLGSFNSDMLFRNRYTDMLQQRLMQTESLLRQMYQLVNDPEQMCRQFVQQGNNGLDQANQALANQQQSLTQSASSLMNKLGGGGGFTFG